MAQSGGGFAYDDHFTPARSRKKRKNRPSTLIPSPVNLLDKAAEELAHTDWLPIAKQTLRDALEDVFPASDVAPDMLCLGLGSPASSRDARAQLAFLIAVCDDLSIGRANVSVFDPIFGEPDLQLLAQLRLTYLPENHEARHALRSPTIVFMPHCDLHLYENILRENWSIEQLPNILLIANRLSDYADSTPSRKLAAERPCLARLVPYLTARPLSACAPFPTAFNSTAFQFVRRSTLAERESEWWALPDDIPGPSVARAPSPGPQSLGSDNKATSAILVVHPKTNPMDAMPQ